MSHATRSLRALSHVTWRIVGWFHRIAPRFGHPRRVPVVLQMNSVECGAACLAMILRYFGHQASLAECRVQCESGRDGVTAQTIAAAARRYGLRVRALSVELAQFRHVPLPAIVHWNFNHFVVVEHWSPAAVRIIDPAAGRRRLTAEAFDVGFTGIVLVLEPSAQFTPRRPTGQPVWRTYLTQILHTPGTWGIVAPVLGASLVLQAFGAALPLCTKMLVDHILAFRMTQMVPILGLGMVLLVLAQATTQYVRAALLIALEARLDTQVMRGFVAHVLALPVRFFHQRTSGDLLMRLGSNTVIRDTLTTQTVSALLDGTFVLGYLTLLLALAPRFGAIVLGIGLLQVVLLLGTTRRLYHLMQQDLGAEAEAQSYLVEALTGIVTLKASGAEERAFDHWSSLFARQMQVALQRKQRAAVLDAALLALRTAAPLVVLWVGALSVLEGTMSLGTMLALYALSMAFLVPIASLVTIGQHVQLVKAHLERLADVVQEAPEHPLQTVQPAPPLSGRIALQRVHFRYDRHASLVLHDLTFRIEPGQKIALVGRTGSGKSTLASLLLGLYAPTDGTILYDGIPLESLDYRTLRRQCGVVLQEPFLFSGSIRQNLVLTNPSASFEHVIEAAQIAAIHDEILHMPMGYETRLAEGGAGLSGGQRQRVAIARALVQRPAILVLDEATSHLDGLTEQRVDQHLSALACTRIVIAHRLSTIRNADLILVLDQGCIVERGTHEALLAQGGLYTALVHGQHEMATDEASSLLVGHAG